MMCGMVGEYQSSLLNELNTTKPVTADTLAAHLSQALSTQTTRRHLDDTSWVDYAPNIIPTPDRLMHLLTETVDWRSDHRQMYDRVVAVPRLERFYTATETLPTPGLAVVRDTLSTHYKTTLGEPFTTTGMCLYRDGQDSVAWHGDDLGRSKTHDTIIAIVSLGSPRTLLLRPKTGGPSISYRLHHGDLLAMGGACQRTWEHAIPKTRTAVGPRISIQFRPHDVR